MVRVLMKTVDKTCLLCGGEFTTSLKEHNRGNGKYCSLVCANRSSGIARTLSVVPNVTCTTCGTAISRKTHLVSKSKTGQFFCSRNCKERAPTTAPSSYRRKAFDVYGCKCQKCGYDAYPTLVQVHHIDRNRENSDINNLQVLCIRCHMEDHFDAGDGPFVTKPTKCIV